MTEPASPGCSGTGSTAPPRPAVPSSGRVPVVLERGHSFEGLLAFSGSAQIDGEFSGEVVSRGTLRIGKVARVRARIEAEEVIVAGQLDGDITARRRIELLATAQVRGDLRAPRVALEDGCVVHGRCVVGTSPGRSSGSGDAPGKSSPLSP